MPGNQTTLPAMAVSAPALSLPYLQFKTFSEIILLV